MDLQPSMKQSERIAVMSAFFTNGVLLSAWLSRIPFIQDDLGLSESALGLALFGGSLGVISALLASGSLIARFGSRRMTTIGAVWFCLMLPMVALMPTGLALAGGLFFFSASISIMDVSMNAQAVVVEQHAKRPLMSSFHAMWSIGAAVGGVIGSQMARLGIVPLWHFLGVSIVFGLLFLPFTFKLVPRERMQEDTLNPDEKAPVFQLPARALWPLGAVAFCAAIGEGALSDWGALYLTDTVGSAESIAAAGYATYAGMMTVGRLAGDQLSKRLGSVQVVRYGGVLATGGLLLAILYPQITTVLIGFGMVGLGLSTIMPLAFSAGGNHPSVASGVGIASVATIGYTGFLAGPPIIGLIAEATSLRIAMMLITALIATLIVSAGAFQVKPQSEVIELPASG